MAEKDTSPEAAEKDLLSVLLGETDDEQDEGAEGDEPDEGAEGDEQDNDEQDDNEGDDSDDEESDDEGESDEDDSDEEESEEGKPAPKVVPVGAVAFTVSDGDTEVPVTAGEAKAGYLRQADYSRKTQDVATALAAIQAERAQLDEALKNVLSLMDGEDADSTPAKLAELARTDPEAATRLRFERDARAETRGRVDAARKELADRTSKEQVEEAKKVQAAEFAKLVEVMPDLKDASKAKTILTRLTGAAVAAGFTEADMNRIGDHRLMKLLDLAATGLRLSAKKAPKPEPKGTKVPAITPGVRARSTSGKDQAAKDAKFKKSRNPDDAADSLMAAMEAAARKRK